MFALVSVLFYFVQISSMISTELSNINPSVQIATLSYEIEKVCFKALGDDHSKDLNYFAYGCFLKKFNENQRETVIEDFKLCCNLLLSKNRHDEELDISNRFCECLDMINIVHQPFIKECTSAKLPQCEKTSSPWGHSDNLREDVGVILVFNRNVMLGGGGIAIFTIMCFISLCGFGYLVFICVLYRCCQNKNDEKIYDENDTVANAYDGGYEMSEASVAVTTTPQATTQSTTQSITQIPLQQQQPKSSSASSITKTKEITNTISVDNI